MTISVLVLVRYTSALYWPLWTLEGGGATSFIRCASACAASVACGGIIFDRTKTPACLLVVDASVPGAVALSSAAPVYRALTYNDGLELYEYPVSTLSWNGAAQECLNRGLVLAPPPNSLKGRASLAIRTGNFFYVDIQRLSNGSYVHWTSMTPFPYSEFFAWLPNNPDNKPSQLCLGMSESPIVFYDYGCSWTDNPTTLFCVG